MASSKTKPWNSLKHIEWMWKSNPNPFSQSEKEQWSRYSDVENIIIERAFSDNKPRAILDDYYIDFKDNLQISKAENYKQRPIKRVKRKRENKHLREARFMDLPVGNGRSFGGQYGWVSPFVVEVRRYLGLKDNEIPSKEPKLIPMLVEKAAAGIIEEGTHMKKLYEAEEIADRLLEKKNNSMKDVWECCVYLYTLESFLYKILNSTMRLIGDKDNQTVWKSKIPTLGPFCLLLWDDPFNTKMTTNKTLYRGANLTPEMITKYQNMANNEDEYGSFQAFTSCSRNREKAAHFGNSLFIMEVEFAFIADLTPLSEYSEEEEELITPGVCFRVHSVELDRKTNKNFIHLQLRQRFNDAGKHEISTFDVTNRTEDKFDADFAFGSYGFAYDYYVDGIYADPNAPGAFDGPDAGPYHANYFNRDGDFTRK